LETKGITAARSSTAKTPDTKEEPTGGLGEGVLNSGAVARGGLLHHRGEQAGPDDRRPAAGGGALELQADG
jgi:hypothetical protein